jgi:hypothetical protein
MNDVVRVSTEAQPGCAVVRLDGGLSFRSIDSVHDTIVWLLNVMRCVVADVSALTPSCPELLLVFPAALADAGGWPQARLGLFGADPELLGQLRAQGVCAAIAVADQLDNVLAATRRRPLQAWAPRVFDANAPPPLQPSIQEAIDGGAHTYQLLPEPENDAGLALFVWERLGCLLDCDHRYGFELVTTLSTYLEHDGNLEMAARDLGIHRSTLRYRLHRIRQISAHDLREVATWLELRIATSSWCAVRTLN